MNLYNLQIIIKCPLKYLNDRFPYPFIYLNLWNPFPLFIPEAWKRYPFRAEPPCIGHYREYPPRFVCDFIAFEIMESELAIHDNCEFHVPCARTSDACALDIRQRIVTVRWKNKRKKKAET